MRLPVLTLNVLNGAGPACLAPATQPHLAQGGACAGAAGGSVLTAPSALARALAVEWQGIPGSERGTGCCCWPGVVSNGALASCARGRMGNIKAGARKTCSRSECGRHRRWSSCQWGWEAAAQRTAWPWLHPQLHLHSWGFRQGAFLLGSSLSASAWLVSWCFASSRWRGRVWDPRATREKRERPSLLRVVLHSA